MKNHSSVKMRYCSPKANQYLEKRCHQQSVMYLRSGAFSGKAQILDFIFVLLATHILRHDV